MKSVLGIIQEPFTLRDQVKLLFIMFTISLTKQLVREVGTELDTDIFFIQLSIFITHDILGYHDSCGMLAPGFFYKCIL